MKKKKLMGMVCSALLIAACGSSGNAVPPAANGTSAPTDQSQVISDLKDLLNSKSIAFTGIPYCTHQSGNQWVCEIDGTQAGTVYPTVTDDGNSIYASGF